jgi:hypothetical protein
MRIAREAHAAGADKYLEELLVWRELAYQWCRHVPDHSSFDALPAWARRTLAAHAQDERAALSWEQLASGRTGDRLWDLAQRSLAMHGELHNNVRMTWGKAVIGWTRSPEAAIATLIDLNNRFALDGADPASYGGILWCLGLFDRPFTPELPVLGSVRPRTTDGHAERLDLDAYERIVSRRTRPWRVAVIGAGISGAARRGSSTTAHSTSRCATRGLRIASRAGGPTASSPSGAVASRRSDRSALRRSRRRRVSWQFRR